jgi:DNA-3-methyladenine glycosylase I
MPRKKSTIPTQPADERRRCRWAANDPLLASYHDDEWGRPIRTDAGHLERMALEVFQCGLSWKIVLTKRPAFRRLFERFDVQRVAAFTARDVERLCRDASIIRNRMKIKAIVANARVFRKIADEHGTYRRWFDGLPAVSARDQKSLFPLFNETFRFMGPETTKCYLMGVGKITPPHEPQCWRSMR